MAVRGVGKLVQVVGRRERELHKTVQERQLGLGVRRGLGRQDNRSCRAVRRVRRVQLVQLGLGRRYSQVGRVCLEVQLDQVHRYSLGLQLGRDNRPCRACQEGQGRLFNKDIC